VKKIITLSLVGCLSLFGMEISLNGDGVVFSQGIKTSHNGNLKTKNTQMNFGNEISVEPGCVIVGNHSFENDDFWTVGSANKNFVTICPKNQKVEVSTSHTLIFNSKYDAWDLGRNANPIKIIEGIVPFFKSKLDKSISTKIVNNTFILTITALKRGNKFGHRFIGEYRLYDVKNNKPITNWRFLAPVPIQWAAFRVNKAYKDVRVQFRDCKRIINKMHGEANGWARNGKGGMEIECSDRTYYSSDDFAIRPYKFEITDIPSKIKAGDEFNLTVKAVDINKNPVKDYNESISTDNSTSVGLEARSAKSNCRNGDITIIEGGEFKDGIAKVKISYNEIGEVNFSVKENNGKEFAKVDEDDTPDNQRFIEENTTQTYLIPEHFKVIGILNNYKGKNVTYLSRDLNMSAVLDLNITAQTKNGETTQNYNKECYAKDINITISKNLVSFPKNLSNTLYIYTDANDKNSSELNVSIDKDIVINNYSSNNFKTDNNGSTMLKVYINFDKNYSNPQNKFNMTITNVNVQDEDVNKAISDIKGNATYLYERIEPKEATGYGNEGNTTFKYYYWDKEKGWIKDTQYSKNFGDVDLDNSYINTTALKNFSEITYSKNDIKNGKEEVEFKTTHSLPYSVKINLAIPSWLWYYPLAKDYKAPSKTNHDCLTHPCLKVTFLSNSTGWGGVETNFKVIKREFNVSKRAVEINASKEANVSKKEVKKINW
jgi:hypothetical protein